ncbi:aldo/keto reductase [Siccirubricoccus sp. KC 17139]|uniref:Aldo/keto reductase n=1 Tax=Siccirubricoccus soli TaxID=2899147 RepID=A0ABT1D702_9PROT|nr:aldo/keto reductase [Siccirubricoccus soli]MCO6416969.1 aldo/keto reductase [Siccirubricoccus soli]MCP2683104.1 aldo/keto reductase [Siccirubricoccus soli]
MPMQVPLFRSARTVMPRLGFGTWPMQGAECQAAVESAIGLGYRHIDTAEMYGNEAAVGAGLRASGVAREALYLTTKVWWDKPDGASFRAAFEACLARLATPYVDLLLVHWPSPQLRLESVLEAQAKILAEGLAKAVGVANFPLALLRRAVEAKIAPIACLQVEHHVFLGQQKLLAYCQAQDLVLTSYTPVAKGAVLQDATVTRIAAKHGATPGQVALAWLLGMANVAAIPKAASPARQAENLKSVELTLDEEDRAALAALPKNRRMVNPGFAPQWDG